MGIYTVKGDLLNSDCSVIAHQANCMSKMGAGIAKQIASKYPEAYHADLNCPMTPEERLGKFSVHCYSDKPLLIFNLYGQYRYGRGKQQTDYHALRSSMNYMCQTLTKLQSKYPFQPFKIGMPKYIGAGLAGGDHQVIYRIIQEVFDAYGLDVYLYEL